MYIVYRFIFTCTNTFFFFWETERAAQILNVSFSPYENRSFQRCMKNINYSILSYYSQGKRYLSLQYKSSNIGKNPTSSNIKWQEYLSKHFRPFIPKGNIIVFIDFTLIYFIHLDKRNFVRKSKGKNFKCYLLAQRRVYC